MKPLRFEVPGKWILAGEHSVVRGGDALVFPLRSRTLTLEASASGSAKLEITSSDTELAKAALACIEEAFRLLGKKTTPAMQLRLESTIPVGSGLGSSAALSVSITKMLSVWDLLPAENIFSFAHSLENLFHGQSSGLDIAAVLAEGPILFSRTAGARALAPKWLPELFLIDSGLRASTKTCVEKVAALARPDLDERMQLAVRLAQYALCEQEKIAGTRTLQEAMVLAQSCYEEWGLVPQMLKDFMRPLAQPVKITGSGSGGFILSWAKTGIPCLT